MNLCIIVIRMRIKSGLIFLSLFMSLIFSVTNAEASDYDTLKFSALNKSSLSFIMDDTYIFGGINKSGIYYSRHFRDLSHGTGYSFGFEQYFPYKRKLFLNAGIGLNQMRFNYGYNDEFVKINNLYLQVPLTAAYELPILKDYDFRLLLGFVIGVRLNSIINGDYDKLLLERPDLLVFTKADFHRGDVGWQFGLSAEHNNFIFRLRSYSGFIKFDKKDQGMQSSFNLEIGYFLFRSLKK